MPINGLLQLGIELGLDLLIVKPKRQIADMPIAHATIEEVHDDEMEITEQPVEQGAMISDHAFKRPAKVLITVGYSDSPGSSSLIGSVVSAVTGTIGGVSSLLNGNSDSGVKAIYAQFLALQASRVLSDVYTGKRVYQNMLVKGIHTVTDKTTENALVLKVSLQQVLIVTQAVAQVVSADPADQENPEDTAPVSEQGALQPTEAQQYNNSAGDASIDTPTSSGTEVFA